MSKDYVEASPSGKSTVEIDVEVVEEGNDAVKRSELGRVTLTQEQVPEVNTWEPGQMYDIQMKVLMLEKRPDYDDKTKARGEFAIITMNTKPGGKYKKKDDADKAVE